MRKKKINEFFKTLAVKLNKMQANSNLILHFDGLANLFLSVAE